MKSGFAEKQFFKFRKIVFSAHAWTASNPCKINMWVDMGTWSIVFPKNLKKTEALRKDNFSSSEKLFYSHMLGMLPILTNWRIPAGIRTFDLQGWSPTRWTLRYRSILILWNSDKPGFAKKKSGSKKLFFSALVMKLRWARLCKKKLSRLYFFLHASCQICQLHLVTSFKLAPNCADACNT